MQHQARCGRCEHICREPVTGPGTLHVRFPLSHTLSKIVAYLARSGQTYTERSGTISIHILTCDFTPLVLGMLTVVSPREQQDVQVIFEPDGKVMQRDDYFAVTSLQSFAAQLQSSWLVDMLREERIATAFQPIVDATAPEQVYAYECLMRGQDTTGLVAPKRLLDVARGADLLFQLDLAARVAAIKGAARHSIKSKIFINFNPTAIYDPNYCLQSTMRTIRESGLQAEQIVFEVVESDHVEDVTHLKTIVDFYRRKNFEVALDDLGSGYSSLNMLHELRPDYVKLDMKLIRAVDQDPYKGLITQKMIEVAHGLGIKTIAEGVESYDEFAWLRQHGADLVQGYFFAKPDLVPPHPQSIMQEADTQGS